MELAIVDAKTTESILTMRKCIELVGNAHANLSNGDADQPLRLGMYPHNAKGLLAVMPAFIKSEPDIYGLKMVSVFPKNQEIGLDTHQASILLINPDTGQLKAIVDGRIITAMRTAAASAIATKYLARKDSKILTLLGAGVQAHTHLEAIEEVMRIEQINIWNRTTKRAQEFAKEYQEKYKINAYNSVKEAVKDADIICTLTASKEPILGFDMLKKGVHINAVGSSSPGARELSTEIITNSSLFTDVLESSLKEAGDIMIPIKENKLSSNPNIIDLGSLITKKHPGRRNDNEITVYKSLGVGIQDIAPASYVYNEALRQNKAQIISFE